MKRFGCIYIITNLVTGKKYVGQTTQKLRRRWRQHCQDKRSGRHLHLSISKYGEHNFRVEEFMVCFSQEALDFYETRLIEELNTFTPNGYNLCMGALKKGIVTDETRRKMREAKLGKKVLNRKGWSDSSKLAFSKKQGGRSILSLNLETKEIKRYDYIEQAVKDGFHNSTVYRSLKLKVPHLGHLFYYEEEYANQNGSSETKESEHVQRLDLEPEQSE